MNEVNVLIVDDEAELRKSVASILGTTMPEYLFRISEAGTGQEAIDRVRAKDFDLVLMDVVMPRMNGFEACKRMRQQPSTREIPIVLVTTRGEESYMEAGFQSGCNDYITKPVDGAELVALLQSYLGE